MLRFVLYIPECTTRRTAKYQTLVSWSVDSKIDHHNWQTWPTAQAQQIKQKTNQVQWIDAREAWISTHPLYTAREQNEGGGDKGCLSALCLPHINNSFPPLLFTTFDIPSTLWSPVPSDWEIILSYYNHHTRGVCAILVAPCTAEWLHLPPRLVALLRRPSTNPGVIRLRCWRRAWRRILSLR